MSTVKQIEAAQYGSSPDRISDGNGLYVRLSKGGAKTFQLRMPENGKTRWITLGKHPELSLRDARMKSMLTRADILDPRHDAIGTANVITMPDLPEKSAQVPLFRDFAKIWYDRKVEGFSNGKHKQQNWNTLVTYVFPQLGAMPIDEIKLRHIIAVFDPILREKHETAKRSLGRVKEVFELAKLREFVEVNPQTGQNLSCTAANVQSLTGKALARRSNLYFLRKQHVVFQQNRWEQPSMSAPAHPKRQNRVPHCRKAALSRNVCTGCRSQEFNCTSLGRR